MGAGDLRLWGPGAQGAGGGTGQLEWTDKRMIILPCSIGHCPLRIRCLKGRQAISAEEKTDRGMNDKKHDTLGIREFDEGEKK